MTSAYVRSARKLRKQYPLSFGASVEQSYRYSSAFDGRAPSWEIK